MPHPPAFGRGGLFLKVKDPSLEGQDRSLEARSSFLAVRRSGIGTRCLMVVGKPLLGALPPAPKLECRTEWVLLLNEGMPVSTP